MRARFGALLALVACADPSSASAPSGTAAAPASATAPSAAAPAKRWPAVRDNASAGAFASGAALDVRAFVSRLTTDDPIYLAIRLRSEQPLEKGHPWHTETVDWTTELPKLAIEIDGPGGKVNLAVAEGPKQRHVVHLAELQHVLTVSKDGLRLAQSATFFAGENMAWKPPPDALFAKPGRYAVKLHGELATKTGTLSLASKPIELEVMEAGPEHKTLAQMQSTAVEHFLAPGVDSLLVLAAMRLPVDDAAGNVSFEVAFPVGDTDAFELSEVIFDASGKELPVVEVVVPKTVGSRRHSGDPWAGWFSRLPTGR